MITYAHDSTIILASIVVSLVAAFSGLALTNKIGSLSVSKRKALIVMSAFVLGGGIWSMHFVAMLAHQFDVPIHYDLLQTLSSALVAILVVGLALLILHFAQRTSMVLTVAGLLLGAGIVSMHFIGMLGMRGVIPIFSGSSIVAAVIVAAVMGVMAIRVSYGTRTNKSIVLGGLLFGFSVVLVHFTAMAGTRFRVDPTYLPVSVVLDPASLAIVVTVTAFVICGTFLLAASTFLTAHPASATLPGSRTVATDEAAVNAPDEMQAIAMVVRTQGPVDEKAHESRQPISTESSEPPVDDPFVDRFAVSAPELLQVAGQEDGVAVLKVSTSTRQPCDGRTAGMDRSGGNGAGNGAGNVVGTSSGNAVAGLILDVDSASESLHLETNGQIRIPFERNKHIEFVLSSHVAAVRADGRYTHLYTRDGVRFCPWSIAEAQKRLEGDLFYRSHRSYLINLQAVAVFEKNRDAGLCRFDGFPQLASVPVSRARVGNLLQHLGL